MILSKGKIFIEWKSNIFTLHYIEHRRKFYHHFLDFFSLSLLISRFDRSLWAELPEKNLNIIRRLKNIEKRTAEQIGIIDNPF